MNADLEIVAELRRLIRHILSESCIAYNTLCGTDHEETAYNALDGELRMASSLAQLEKKLR